MWVADGSNYPGTQSMRERIGWMQEILNSVHAALGPEQRMLVEYKPFEPAFYHTDIADWGMALELARTAGPKARVLVDTGHHYQAQNIEQIVAWLLHLHMLGGFHFNDRRYADDDLTLGSIDPYQVFRIFHELMQDAPSGKAADIAFMIDQSHNMKGKIEAMIQTVSTAQELFARAALVIVRDWPSCSRRASWWTPRSVFVERSGRCAAVCKAMAQEEGSFRGPIGSAARERLRGAHHRRASRKECGFRIFVRIARLRYSRCYRCLLYVEPPLFSHVCSTVASFGAVSHAMPVLIMKPQIGS